MILSLLDVEEGMKKRTKRKKVPLDPADIRIVSRALLDYRNQMIRKNNAGASDVLGELLLRFNS